MNQSGIKRLEAEKVAHVTLFQPDCFAYSKIKHIFTLKKMAHVPHIRCTMEIKRDIYLNQLVNARQNGLIKVVTGPCRCGKSYLRKTLKI